MSKKLFLEWFKLGWLTAAIIFICLVFILSHIPQENLAEHSVLIRIDKFLHILAYGIITFLIISAIKFRPYLRINLIVFVLVISLGYLDEYTQGFVGRTVSVVDWLADILGVVLGLILFEIRHRLHVLRWRPSWN